MVGTSSSSAVAILSLLAVASGAAAAEQPLRPACSQSWTAELTSDSIIGGSAAVSSLTQDSLGVEVSVQGGHGISLAELIVVPESPGSGTLIFVLTHCKGPSCAAPYVLQVTQEVVHVIQLEASKGNVKVVVTVTSDVNLRLHGALLSDCERETALSAVVDVPDMPEALIIRQSRVFSFLEALEAQDPEPGTDIFCPLPQAPKAYTIPEGCHGVQERLQAHCGLSPQSVALASGFLFSSNSQPFAGFGVGYSICVPEDCNPCEIETAKEPTYSVSWPVFDTMGLQRCPIKGLDTEYIVPPGCDHFAEHAQAICGVDPDMLQSPEFVADVSLLGPWDSVCLPQGCEPCRNAGILTPEALKETENADKLSKKNPSTGLAASGQQAAGSWMSKVVNGVKVWVNGK